MCVGLMKRLNTWLSRRPPDSYTNTDNALPPLKKRHVGVKGLDGDLP